MLQGALQKTGIVLLGVLFAIQMMFAGSTGKVTGKVVDATTGEAIVGANVVIVGSMIGANTDVDGRFSIIGVPIGAQTIRVTFIGYADLLIKDIKIAADQTTPLDVKLSSSAVEMNTVVITGERLVNKLTTSSVQTVNSKTIDQIPNVKSVEDVMALQAGVVKQGQNLFLRGGRANEVQYVVDGIPVNNITGNSGELTATSSVNDQLRDLYSGTQAGSIGGGSSGLAVSANAIQTVSVQTSGFDADYGNSQSGIVNIVTKSGGENYTGSVSYRTDKIAATNFNENYGSFNFGGPEPLSKYLLPQLGVNLPGNLTFFISADMNRTDGPYNYANNEFYNPLRRRLKFDGFLGGLFNGLGITYEDNQRNSFTLNSKVKWDISSSDQISYGYRASLGSGHDYLRSWRYRADSSAVKQNISTQDILSWTHFFSDKTFSKVYLGRVENNETNDVSGLLPPQYSSARDEQDINKDSFYDLGTGQRWYFSTNRVWTARFDINSQVHPLHLIKTGVEFNYEEVRSTEILYPTVPISTVDGLIYPPFPEDLREYADRGLYPGYGIYRWALNNYPNRGAFYVQDNIEFEGLNLHVGLRYDYFDLGKQINDPDFISAWEKAANATESGSGDLVKAAWVDKVTNNSTFLYYVLHGHFSPRLSIGYPVTDRIVFYFNYGHFLQFPERDNYFKDAFIQGASDNWIGNPELKPQRTVQYEAGFDDQVTDDMAFTVHAFYKDIFDYSTLNKLPNAANYIYTNLDYASARGFELTLQKSFSGNFSASATYSYQIAKGRASNPLASVFSPGFQLPREVRLDWDQQHTANFFASYRVGPREDAKIFGIPFVNNWGASLTWSFGSGFPYTSYKGRDTERNVLLVNNQTMPYSTTFNLSIYKGFYVLDKINVSVTLDIENLLNRRNVSRVNTYTDRPSQYGDYDPDSKEVYEYYRSAYRTDATLFEAGRQIFLGLKLNWE
jgi:outer membrane receptor protein involved in Fe transport